MQIVIDIPNSTFTDLKKKKNRTEVDLAVLNGIPLAKGHGKLVDVTSIPEEDREITIIGLTYPGTIAHMGSIDLEEYVNNLPAIIEADTESEK